MWLYDKVEEKSGFLSIERLFESLESSETWSRSYADELTSARATATISSGIGIKPSEWYAVSRYPSWQPFSLQHRLVCRSNCQWRSQSPPNSPFLHTY